MLFHKQKLEIARKKSAIGQQVQRTFSKITTSFVPNKPKNWKNENKPITRMQIPIFFTLFIHRDT